MQFKLSSSIKRPIFIVSSLFLFLSSAFISCQLQQGRSPNPFEPFRGDSKLERRMVLQFKDPSLKEPIVLAKVNRQRCRDWLNSGTEPILQEWVLPFHSPIGSELVKVHFTAESDSLGATISVDQWRVLSNSTQEMPASLIRDLCVAARDGKEIFTTDSVRAKTTVSQWLAHLSPDCRISIRQKYGLFCSFESAEPNLVESELRSLRKTVIRRWSRQPYLFTRRLALTIQLAEALQSKNPLGALDSLCKVIRISEPIEVPLALASRRWSDAVCVKVSGIRIEAAALGLTKAFAEVEFLRQLFERTSRLGILTVRIPRDKLPTKDLWISLIPGKDVGQKLKQESRRLGSAEITSVPGDFSQPKSCWHPLFSSSSETMQIARQLDLTATSAGVSCLDQGIDHDRVDQYFADNITSETEFVLTNGRSKILRLPIGDYQYVLQGHSEALGYSPVSDVTSRGTIAWNGRRGGAKITNW